MISINRLNMAGIKNEDSHEVALERRFSKSCMAKLWYICGRSLNP